MHEIIKRTHAVKNNAIHDIMHRDVIFNRHFSVLKRKQDTYYVK